MVLRTIGLLTRYDDKNRQRAKSIPCNGGVRSLNEFPDV